jgi:hypothetical protein
MAAVLRIVWKSENNENSYWWRIWGDLFLLA